MLHQLVFKLQGFKAVFAETVCVFAFYIHPLFMTEFGCAALTGRYIAHFALKCLGASRAIFYFMLVCHSNQSNVK